MFCAHHVLLVLCVPVLISYLQRPQKVAVGSTNLGFPKPERTTNDAKKLYPLTGLMYRSYAQKACLMENLQFWVCEFNTVQGLRMNYPGLFELVAKFCQWINLHLLEIKQRTLFDDS